MYVFLNDSGNGLTNSSYMAQIIPINDHNKTDITHIATTIEMKASKVSIKFCMG